MSKTHKLSSHPIRIPEDVLAEHWFSFVHDVFAELKAAIARRGISQDEIAARLGKDPATISRCLSGRHNVTLRTMCDIARAIGHRPEIQFQDLSAVRRVRARDTGPNARHRLNRDGARSTSTEKSDATA